MFVCLARYLDVLAFPPKFMNVDFKAGILSVKLRKKSKYPIIFKFVLINNMAHQRALVFAIFMPTY